MRTKLLLSLFTITTAIVFDACLKKGEDDPFISLRTRNARLIGEWKLVSMESESAYFDDWGDGLTAFDHKTTEKFDGTTLTVTRDNKDKSGGVWTYSYSTTTYNYSNSSTFNKDGTSSCITTKAETSPAPSPTETYTSTGAWFWVDSKKKKTYLIASECIVGDVSRLSNKELVIEYENLEERSGGSNPNKNSYKEKSTYEKKK